MADLVKDGISVHGARLSRRGFLATGGAMVVGLTVLQGCSQDAAVEAAAEAGGDPLAGKIDPNIASSWIEIHADNTVRIRTGKCDFGQSSIYTAYPQIIADELGMPFEAITQVVSGDTDRTPDGGGTFGLLGGNVMNLRKVAAITREAVLELAAERFGVAKGDLAIEDGVISGGGQSATYGELVAGLDLQLAIPARGALTGIMGLSVEGDPPLKSVRDYKVVGKPFKNPLTAQKVAAKTTWVADVTVPNMLHARTVHPATLGSTLVSVGELDASQFPTSRVVTVGDLVAVVADTEWEAIRASRSLASSTQWTEWKGLPGSARLRDYFRNEAEWDVVPPGQSRANKGDAPAAIAGAARVHSASYELPYHKHAPIGPSMALADVREDGSVTVHTHTQNPQSLREQIATMLDISIEQVVVRTYPGSGHYGRSNGGNAGSENEAVLIARAVGRPVRLQWMRPEDLQWSTQSAPALADIDIAVDDAGKITGYKAEHWGPPMQDDRPIGAVLAGLPAMMAPVPENPDFLRGIGAFMADDWVYAPIENVSEQAHSTWQLGHQASPLNIGLRDHSLRTPGQYQQNFPREVAMTEAASLAGLDPIDFRIANISEPRLIRVLERLRAEAGWETRPSPRPGASATGDARQVGQGASVMYRGNAYWACAARVAVTPSSGEVKVEAFTVVVDPGVVVNPLQLKRQIEAGALMGVSQAMHEELAFDEGAITSRDWFTYPILTMAEMPDVKVVIAPDPTVEIYGQGSEGANALALSSIASALFDATGKPIRKLPLRPEYVQAMLTA